MRIYMQMPASDDKAPRYYHIHLQEDLLEGWTLIREWGFQGTGGRILTEYFTQRDDAEQAMMKVRDDQLKRGYQVVFVQGQTQP